MNLHVHGSVWILLLSHRLWVQDNKDAYPAHQRLQSMLTNVLEELPDVPLYYSVHELSKLLRVPPPPQDTFRSALVNAGKLPP